MLAKTGIITKLLVYNGANQVGYGYVIVDNNGKILAPNLFANDGSQLPKAWYNLVATGKDELVVLTRRKQ